MQVGAVATPIWRKAEQVDLTPYLDTPYAPALKQMRAYMLTLGKEGLPPERIGGAVLHVLTAAHPKVRTIVTPHRFQDFLARHLPKRIVDRMIGGRLGLLPPPR